MIKMLAAVTRRPGMTHAEYLAYIQHVHGKITTGNLSNAMAAFSDLSYGFNFEFFRVSFTAHKHLSS